MTAGNQKSNNSQSLINHSLTLRPGKATRNYFASRNLTFFRDCETGFPRVSAHPRLIDRVYLVEEPRVNYKQTNRPGVSDNAICVNCRQTEQKDGLISCPTARCDANKATDVFLESIIWGGPIIFALATIRSVVRGISNISFRWDVSLYRWQYRLKRIIPPRLDSLN